jgi:hypothetical protein
MNDVLGMKILQSAGYLIYLNEASVMIRGWMTAVLTKTGIESSHSPPHLFTRAPFFIHGDTIQRNPGNVSESTPRKGRM